MAATHTEPAERLRRPGARSGKEGTDGLHARSHHPAILAHVPGRRPPELEREPLVENQRGFAWISDRIAGVAEGKTPLWWWAAFVPSVLLMLRVLRA